MRANEKIGAILFYEEMAFLEHLGEGNRTAGLRVAIEMVKDFDFSSNELKIDKMLLTAKFQNSFSIDPTLVYKLVHYQKIGFTEAIRRIILAAGLEKFILDSQKKSR